MVVLSEVMDGHQTLIVVHQKVMTGHQKVIVVLSKVMAVHQSLIIDHQKVMTILSMRQDFGHSLPDVPQGLIPVEQDVVTDRLSERSSIW